MQATAELDASVFTMMRMHEDPSVDDWAAEHLPAGSVIGVDATTMSIAAMKRLTNALNAAGPEKVTVKAMYGPGENLVDKVWGDARPAVPASQVFLHSVKYAGETVADKLGKIRAAMKERDATMLVVTGLDEVAWLLNLRASDVSYNPVFWSYAIVTTDGITLYCDSSRFGPGVVEQLKADNVAVRPYGAIMTDLESMPLPPGANVWLDINVCNYAIQCCLSKRTDENAVEIIKKQGPIPLLKAAKNVVELSGMRAAHVRDGVAVCKFLRWIEEEVVTHGREPTECEAADKLDGLRAQQDLFVSLSFPTISSAGANCAVIHYRPTEDTCAKITRKDMYLVDSGGQYRDGTTDVTRTMHFGEPSKWERECFTRVLKGHIAIDVAIFPSTTGHVLDAFARAPLWQGGLDYKHGTGHGVGSFLNVHEGPHVLSFKTQALGTALEPGFLTSNEPGYYEEGNFGIRIENICVVEETGMDTWLAKERPFYRMAHVTFVPLQAKLMDPELMTKAEIAWVDKYHAECYEKLSPGLHDDPGTMEWLRVNTRPLLVQFGAVNGTL